MLMEKSLVSNVIFQTVEKEKKKKWEPLAIEWNNHAK